ncbi:NRAMP family divalent metal transporter [Sediminispirochaeta smaragdinae]|jgi:Mn2+/Fe2+ NRAMP family transporter|uniref:Natural resistance-associated macrophage protein n=1 Tax=Sediminispirochaeta smaragdinae (strain DSM 11293 / JCM 15392 / SEBR 4228) TaxID=573413 RepID=E1RA68_SEDSS|nr:divalent metal cation transporter [Sediminispirochaeta smaragdinae]ADK79359.1 natural resistance-associated macrophage protein [Sediminispirochaeta smaragdinae DSM 11293]
MDKKGKGISQLAFLLGPGVITAATVLGPGSITVSSKSGALMEYSVLWAVVIAGIFMATFTRMAARIGCLNDDSLLNIVRTKQHPVLAVVVGLSVFLIAGGFQTGNNIGVGLAMDAMFGGGIMLWAPVFTIIALLFIWISRDFYKLLEKVMMTLVVIMIVAFIANVFMAGPSVGKIALGLVPSQPKIWGLVIAISATSFSIAAAAYQAYLVQGKGWSAAFLKKAQRDATIGIVILCGLAALIMITSAAVLAPRGIGVKSAVDMAIQLEPLLGPLAKWLFLFGLLAASFSSFISNAVLGGMFLSDGFGLGKSLNDISVKVFTTVLLLFSTTLAVILKTNPIEVLVVAQASTILGGPLVAIVLLLLGNNKDVLQEHTNKPVTNVIAVLAILWISYLSYNQLMAFIG